ncbi:MAG: type II toxin-antitoxin system HicA family toxin [Thermoleophilia bacterium]|nr:type II toxin-antitoxin system HicA family toxin [Thermoleophilia bacterium]
MPRKVREVCAVLSAAGWRRVSQTGSHEKWRSPDGTRTVTVAGKDSTTLSPGTLASIRRRTGLDGLR